MSRGSLAGSCAPPAFAWPVGSSRPDASMRRLVCVRTLGGGAAATERGRSVWADKQEGKRRPMAFRSLRSLQPLSARQPLLQRPPRWAAVNRGGRFLSFLGKKNENQTLEDGKKMTHRRGWWWRVGIEPGGGTELEPHGPQRCTGRIPFPPPSSTGTCSRVALEAHLPLINGARLPCARPERHQQHAREGHKNALAFFCSSCREVGKGVSMLARWILLHHRRIGKPRGGGLRGSEGL